MMKKKWMMFSLLAISLLLTSVALAHGTPGINWGVIAGGGGSTSTGGTALDSVIGQWAVAGGTSGTTEVGSGFWGGGGAEVGKSATYKIFLPLVPRR